jgi:16S rRNA (cytidine1402-2'-O)-methyltransferase
MAAIIYLIPSLLAEGATEPLPTYLLENIKKCTVLFVENERTSRRYLKLLSKEIVIDDFEWYNMKEIDDGIKNTFKLKIKEGKTIGIISEAGCPGIADPGQELVAVAQELDVAVKPLVGPNSILLALMASGMNGQQFQFVGYVPIDSVERFNYIKHLENVSRQKNCTQIFIETPYRNDHLLEALIKSCESKTKICVAVDITSSSESIQTKTVQQWKSERPALHKRPAIFLLYSGI